MTDFGSEPFERREIIFHVIVRSPVDLSGLGELGSRAIARSYGSRRGVHPTTSEVARNIRAGDAADEIALAAEAPTCRAIPMARHHSSGSDPILRETFSSRGRTESTSDVLHPSAPDEDKRAPAQETPEGHAVRLDDQRRITHLTAIDAKWLLDRDGGFVATLLDGRQLRLGRDDVAGLVV